MIKWQESYSTGVDKLDQQHKSIFMYCNELEEGLKSSGVSKQTMRQALNFLERYITGHFGQEETCMHQCACPIAEKNKFAHQQFIDTYKSFQKKVNEDDDGDGALKELHRFLETWITEHIIRIDTQLKPFVH